MLFKALNRHIKKIISSKEIKAENEWEKQNSCPIYSELIGVLDEDLNKIRGIVGTSLDIKVTTFNFGENSELNGAVIFVDGLVNQELIAQSILQPLKLFKGNEIYMPSSPAM